MLGCFKNFGLTSGGARLAGVKLRNKINMPD
jgi:hypothetical protein